MATLYSSCYATASFIVPFTVHLATPQKMDTAGMKLLHPMRLTRAVGVLCIALHVQACGFFEPSRMSSASRSTPVAGSAPASSPAPVARVPVDPRAPTYTVQRGDNLYRIALDHGQAWRDLAAWNNLEDPGKIEVGQVLRVLPPEGGALQWWLPSPWVRRLCLRPWLLVQWLQYSP
jgi:hypothetical protein